MSLLLMRLTANQLYRYDQDHQCGGCSSLLSITKDETKNLVCKSCGTLHVLQKSLVYDGEFRLDEIHKNKFQKSNSTIPTGTKLTLKGIDLEVVGVLKKAEGNTTYTWQEYYLYNAKVGYCFLTEYQGHWTFLEEIHDKKLIKEDTNDNEAVYNHDYYRLFSYYHASIKGANGEFPIDLLKVPKTLVKEYILPPLLITSEKNDNKKHWFKGEYLSIEELDEALQGKIRLPEIFGVGVLEPYIPRVRFTELMQISVVAVALLLFIQIYFSRSELVFEKKFYAETIGEMRTVSGGYDSTKVYVSPSFQLKNGNANVEFTLDANVDNNWLETDIVLVNEKTGDEYNVLMGVEFYSGIEQGESWTEGSHDTDAMLEKIPEGLYHLEISPSSTFPNLVSSFTVRVHRGVGVYSGFILVLLLLSIYPCISYYQEKTFEYRRWQASDYSPFDEESWLDIFNQN
ncbi:DUF4178 domain-containing protein [Arcicella sp. DC2W]|uniref:DUF4178 domain-containing protein n=1 Tax=Arcicella gelida TaxID=2984195 RepID=A0ABU5S353_9BACT|nr:DUF4178 domain-containing protein [Arcicella sp. DC2W]MEA5402872.1 DUF4178 domain-containing protein [Arcicella sp. DC2W]